MEFATEDIVRLGRTLDQACCEFSDPKQVAQAAEFESAKEPIMGWILGMAPTPHENKHQAYWRIRKPLETALVNKLKAGRLIALGLEVPLAPSSTHEIVNPQLWHVLEPDFDVSAAEGGGLKVIDIRIFKAEEMETAGLYGGEPPNEAYTPPAIVPNADYSIVAIGSFEYRFGLLQAMVIRELHAASRTLDPWRSGKALLADAGAKTRSIGDLFRRHDTWRRLIEEKRGLYRLRNIQV